MLCWRAASVSPRPRCVIVHSASGLVNELRTSALEKPMPPAIIARKYILVRCDAWQIADTLLRAFDWQTSYVYYYTRIYLCLCFARYPTIVCSMCLCGIDGINRNADRKFYIVPSEQRNVQTLSCRFENICVKNWDIYANGARSAPEGVVISDNVLFMSVYRSVPLAATLYSGQPPATLYSGQPPATRYTHASHLSYIRRLVAP